MGNFRQGDRRDNRGGGGRNFRDRGRSQMHEATCGECGRRCEVPFRPTGDKPVYCSECFENSGRGQSRPKRENFRPRFDERPKADNSELKDQINKLDAKLDRILKILAPVVSAEPEKTKEEEVVKETVKKTPAKKTAAKKAPAKKTPAKKATKKVAKKKA